MSAYFLDTSALVKRYVAETGTARVQALTDPAAAHSLFISRLSHVEMTSALTRRERGGSLSASDTLTVLADFRFDFLRQYAVIGLAEALVAEAATLARRHGLRAYDAVQLASALEVFARAPALTLVSADHELNAAAQAEGLGVEDPNAHP